MENDSNNDHQSCFKKLSRSFFTFIVKSQLDYPRELFNLTILSFWIQFFQISSLSISFKNDTNDINSFTWNEGWKPFIYLVRPIQIIYSQHDRSNQTINVVVIIFITIFLIAQIAFGVGGAHLILIKNYKRLGHYLLLMFVNTCAFFNSILCVVITEPLLLLTLNGGLVNESNIQSSQNLLTSREKSINQALGGILLLFFQMYSLFCSKFYEISYSLEERGIQKYSQDTFAIILNHFKIGAVLGYVYDTNNRKGGQLISACISFLYFIAMIYQSYQKMPFSQITKLKQYLLSLVVNLFFLIFMVLNKLIALTSNSTSIAFILILLPLSVKGTFEIANNFCDRYLYSNFLDDSEFTQKNLEDLSKKIAMIHNNRFLIMKKNQLKLIGDYEHHKLMCKRLTCFCKNSISSCNEESVFLMSYDIFERYLRYLIRQELSYSNLNEEIERFIFFIRLILLENRYLIFLSKNFKHSFAISKIIEFIGESDRMRKKHGIFVKVCVEILLTILKQIMYENIELIITEEEVRDQLSDIDLYIRMDNKKNELKVIANKCIKKRIEILEKMKKNFEDFSELERLNSEYNTFLDILEERFSVFFHKFPTSQNQNFFIFFEAEIKGNPKKASQVSNIRKFLVTSNPKKLFNLFSPNVLYLTVTIGKIWGKIINFSDKLPGALGYNKQEFNYINHIKDLMPTTVSGIHDELIRCMMTVGNDGIVNNQRQIFVKHKTNILVRVKVFIGMNLYFQEELPFGVFVTPIQTKSGFLFITNQGYVEGLDFGFLNLIGEEVTPLPPFFQIRVASLIPEFSEYSKHMEENKLTYYEITDVQFNFLAKTHPLYQKIFNYKKQEMINEMIKSSQGMIRISSELSRKSHFQSSYSHMIYFKADLIIERHSIRMMNFDYIYFVVEVKQLIKIDANEMTGKNEQFSSSFFPKNIIDEERDSDSENSALNKQGEAIDTHLKTYQMTTNNQQIGSSQNIELTDEHKTNHNNNNKYDKYDTMYNSEIYKAYDGDIEIVSFNQKANSLFAQNSLKDEQNQESILDTRNKLKNHNNSTSQKDISEDTLNCFEMNEFNHAEAINNSQMITQDHTLLHSLKYFGTNHSSNLFSPFQNGQLSANLSKKLEDIAKHEKDQDLNDTVNTNEGPQLEQNQQNNNEIASIQSSHSQNNDTKFDLKQIMNKEEREGSVCDYNNPITRSIDKYSYYEEFISSQELPMSLKMIGVSRTLEYIMLLAATIASILTLYTSFDNLLKYIDSLALPSNILLSYSNSIILSNTRYILYQLGSSSMATTHSSILQQRQSNQFQNSQSIIVTEWQNSYLTNYFQERQIDIILVYSLINLGFTQETNLFQSTSHLLYSLGQVQCNNKAIQNIKNYPYLFYLLEYSQADILKQFYLPEREFMAINLQQFISFFSLQMSQTSSSSSRYVQEMKDNTVAQTVILNIITLGIFLLSMWNYFQFQKNIMSILKMCETATTISVEIEMNRFKKMEEQFEESEDILFNYVFHMQDKETEIINAITTLESKAIADKKKLMQSGVLGAVGKRKKLFVNVQKERLRQWRFICFGVVCYFIFLAFTLSSYFLNITFLNSFEPALTYYEGVAKASQYISQLGALRCLINEAAWLETEIDKEKSTQYLKVDKDELKQFYSNSLEQLISFNQILLSFNKLTLFGSDFISSLDTIINENICNTADDKLDDSWEINRCTSVLQGILTQGFQSSISKWHDLFLSFEQLNYIESESGMELYLDRLDQSYISVTLSNFTLAFRNKIKDNLISTTQTQKYLNLSISICFITLASLFYGYELSKGLKAIIRRFKMAKKIIFLVPQQTAMIEDTFIKILKAISIRLEIVK